MRGMTGTIARSPRLRFIIEYNDRFLAHTVPAPQFLDEIHGLGFRVLKILQASGKNYNLGGANSASRGFRGNTGLGDNRAGGIGAQSGVHNFRLESHAEQCSRRKSPHEGHQGSTKVLRGHFVLFVCGFAFGCDLQAWHPSNLQFRPYL